MSDEVFSDPPSPTTPPSPSLDFDFLQDFGGSDEYNFKEVIGDEIDNLGTMPTCAQSSYVDTNGLVEF